MNQEQALEQTQTTEKTPGASRTIDTLIAAGLALFVLGLPFHLVVKKLVPDPIGTYWKEILFGLLIVLWAVQCVRSRRVLLSGTPLDGAVLAYLALFLLRFALDRSAWVGAWGLYVSVLYLPLFWLVPRALRAGPRERHPERVQGTLWLVALLVCTGGIAALGGLTEFVLDVPLWPSDEIRQRLGHPDFYIYGTHVRRVYFTFDSPTALANTLAPLLPLALALASMPAPLDATRARRAWTWARAGSGVAAILIAACFVVTFSRGIWVATALSLLVMG